jgi:hypothetical protein
MKCVMLGERFQKREIRMARLESILGGRLGRPGDMMAGKPPRAPKAPEPPKPINQKKPAIKKCDPRTNREIDLERDNRNCGD